MSESSSTADGHDPRRGREPELCLRGGTVVTCDAKHRVLRADLLVRGNRVARIGRVARTRTQREVDVRGCLVLPGLVMAHVHLCQTLMRGAADDLPLLAWLQQRVWPLEAAHDPRSLRASAELGLVELLRAGATCLLDLGTVHDYDVVLEACQQAGVRVVGGKALMDQGDRVPRRLRETTRNALRTTEQLAENWRSIAPDRIRIAWIPRFILSCSEALVRGAVEHAASHQELLHTHAAEHPAESHAVRSRWGRSDVAMLRRWGFRGRRASIAHGVQLSPAECRTLGRDGTGVVHCPSANLKLGSGLAPVAAMRAAGIPVGLGPDGAACNNSLEPWLELRHAALVAGVRGGPGDLPARDVLRLATIEGAQILDLDQEIGSLEVGKQADIVVVRCTEPHHTPVRTPESTLVYTARARDVAHVWVAGRQLVEDGELTTLDAERVTATAQREAHRLIRRANV